MGTYNGKRLSLVYIYVLFPGRFGEDSLEVAESSFVLASGYLSGDDDDNEKANKYLEDAISLYMKYKGPYDNSTILAQVSLRILALLICLLGRKLFEKALYLTCVAGI